MRRAKYVMQWLFVCFLLLGMRAWAQDSVTYVYTDPQGTPLAEADVNGNITATFEYTPYGTYAPQGTSTPGPTPGGPGYTGHVNDPETSFVYAQARYYDPVEGRFISVDPEAIGEGDTSTFNRYSYAANNPIINTDPTGRFAFETAFLGNKFEGESRGGMFGRDVQCSFCLDTASSSDPEIKTLAGATVTAKVPSTGATAGAAIGFILSLPVDGAEDFFSGGPAIVANPATTGAMTAGGAYVGNEVQQGLTNLVQMMNKRFTSHGSDRASEAKTDSHRSVGDQNSVINDGRKFIDNDTGNTVHVSGDRVVVTDGNGRIVTQFKNPRANTNARIASGRWTPLD